MREEERKKKQREKEREKERERNMKENRKRETERKKKRDKERKRGGEREIFLKNQDNFLDPPVYSSTGIFLYFWTFLDIDDIINF